MKIKTKTKRLLSSNFTSSNMMTSGLGNVRLRLLLVDEAKLEVVVIMLRASTVSEGTSINDVRFYGR